MQPQDMHLRALFQVRRYLGLKEGGKGDTWNYICGAEGGTHGDGPSDTAASVTYDDDDNEGAACQNAVLTLARVVVLLTASSYSSAT